MITPVQEKQTKDGKKDVWADTRGATVVENRT
jgi:hypothetical protein